MSPFYLLTVYCLLILGASLLGGWVPMIVHLTHQRMQLAISLVAGFMLGVALLHMLPHALEAGAEPQPVLTWMMTGLLAMFFIERFFCFHHHDAPEAHAIEAAHTQEMKEHEEASHQHEHANHHAQHSTHKLTWSGAALGLTLHSIIGGVALAAGVAAQEAHGLDTRFAGLAVFFVIFLHKPFDSMSLITLMSVGGWAGWSRHLANALFSLCIPLGVLLFYAGYGWLSHEASGVVSHALAFSAGTFLCISLSDLLPELQFHHHDRGKLSAALLLGLALAWATSLAEGHAHEHELDHDQNTPAVIHETHEHADIGH